MRQETPLTYADRAASLAALNHLIREREGGRLS